MVVDTDGKEIGEDGREDVDGKMIVGKDQGEEEDRFQQGLPREAAEGEEPGEGRAREEEDPRGQGGHPEGEEEGVLEEGVHHSPGRRKP